MIYVKFEVYVKSKFNIISADDMLTFKYMEYYRNV